jgi:hypothetical protein
MLSLLTAFAAATTQPVTASNSPELGRTAWVFSTVGHSEWCPAGHVMLDLVTGRYSLTPRAARPACSNRKLDRPIKKGTLSGTQLASIRAAYLRAVAEGLESQACIDGQPHEIVISNGGTPILVVATGYATRSPPEDVGCWGDTANTLHDLLDRLFSPDDYRRRRR